MSQEVPPPNYDLRERLSFIPQGAALALAVRCAERVVHLCNVEECKDELSFATAALVGAPRWDSTPKQITEATKKAEHALRVVSKLEGLDDMTVLAVEPVIKSVLCALKAAAQCSGKKQAKIASFCAESIMHSMCAVISVVHPSELAMAKAWAFVLDDYYRLRNVATKCGWKNDTMVDHAMVLGPLWGSGQPQW